MELVASLPHGPVIHTMSRESGLAETPVGMGFSSVAWPAANRAVYIPFMVYNTFKVTYISALNNTATGNYDLGICDAHGTLLASTGSQTIPTSNVNLTKALDVTLYPGLYYLMLSYDGTGNWYQYTWTTAQRWQSKGVFQQASAFPLPANATFASYTNTSVPVVMISGRSGFF